jgi:hypothetical protein
MTGLRDGLIKTAFRLVQKLNDCLPASVGIDPKRPGMTQKGSKRPGMTIKVSRGTGTYIKIAE